MILFISLLIYLFIGLIISSEAVLEYFNIAKTYPHLDFLQFKVKDLLFCFFFGVFFAPIISLILGINFIFNKIFNFTSKILGMKIFP